MQRYRRRFPALALFAVALAVGCSSNSPTYSPGPPGPGGPTPTPSGATPSPTPSGATPSPTPSGATPTPTPAPTVTPTTAPTVAPTATPTTVPTGVPTGAISCTGAATNGIPGTYTSITTFGNVSGTTYTQALGQWTADAYVVATPTPLPTPTGTAEPTSTPNPTPTTYIEYAGTYNVGGFSGTGATGAFTAAATAGCFVAIASQNGTPIVAGLYNAVGLGSPNFTIDTNSTTVGNGAISSFTITGLTGASGTGNFTLDNAVTGTATITSSQVISFARARQLFERSRIKNVRRR